MSRLSLVPLVLFVAACSGRSNRAHLGPGAWTSAQWQARCGGVRTSFNPSHELSDSERPGAARVTPLAHQ